MGKSNLLSSNDQTGAWRAHTHFLLTLYREPKNWMTAKFNAQEGAFCFFCCQA
jgi:hypothetical protein